MAIPKDTKATASPAAPKAAPESQLYAAKRDDFSFSLDNMLRWWGMDNQVRNEHEASERAEEFARFQKMLDEEFKALNADDLEEKGILSAFDLLRIDPNDQRAMNMRIGEVTDTSTGERHYLAGRELTRYEVRHSAESLLGKIGLDGLLSGGKTTTFRVSTAGEIQGNLVAAIDKASKLTGVPAALIGAMSGIESGFGKNLVSPTGAVGTFQQTGGYRDANWAKHGDFIAQHVESARLAMQGGLSKDEKKALAFDNESAALMTALAAKDFAAKRGLDLNDKRTWGLVYAEHNSGAASVDRMLRGEMTDKFIRDCNPAVYRGVNTAQDALAGFQSKIMSYANAYEKLEAKHEATQLAAAKPAADAAIAKASSIKLASNVGTGAKPELTLQ